MIRIPRWMAELLSPTPGCQCQTCVAIRREQLRLREGVETYIPREKRQVA